MVGVALGVYSVCAPVEGANQQLAFAGVGLVPRMPSMRIHRSVARDSGAGLLKMSGFGFASKKDTFQYTGTQRPSLWPKELKKVPSTIMKPEYADKVGAPAHIARLVDCTSALSLK